MDHTRLELEVSDWDGEKFKLELRLHYQSQTGETIDVDVTPSITVDWQELVLLGADEQAKRLRALVGGSIKRLWTASYPLNKTVYVSLYISCNALPLQLLPWESAFFQNALACGLPDKSSVQRLARYVPSVEDPRPQRSHGPPPRIYAIGYGLATASVTVSGATGRTVDLRFAPTEQLDLGSLFSALGGNSAASEEDLRLAPQDRILVLIAALQPSGPDIEAMLPGSRGLPTYVPLPLLAAKLRSLGVKAPRLIVLAPCIADKLGRSPETIYSQRATALRAGHQLASAGIPGVVVLPSSASSESVQKFIVRFAVLMTNALEHEEDGLPLSPGGQPVPAAVKATAKDKSDWDTTLEKLIAEVPKDQHQPDEDLARLVRCAQEGLFNGTGEPVVFIGTAAGTLWTVPRFHGPVPKALAGTDFVPFIGPDFPGAERIFAQGPVRKIAQLVRPPSHREHSADPYQLGSFLQIEKSRQQLETLYLQAWAEALHRFKRIYDATMPQVISKIPATLQGWEKKKLTEAEKDLNISIESFRQYKKEFWENNPYGELAKLEQKVYVVTDPSPLLYFALKAYGKEPDFTVFAPATGWDGAMARGLRHRLEKAAAGDYESKDGKDVETSKDVPTVASPLIVHLMGHLWDPDTLCLTQDDLANWLFRARLNQLQLLSLIGHSLQIGKLLFVGFDVADFVFQLLVRALLATNSGMAKNMHTLVSVVPSTSQFAYPQEAAKFVKGLYSQILSQVLTQSDQPPAADESRQIFWGDGLHLIQKINKPKRGTP